MLHGGGDLIADPEGSARFFEALPQGNCTRVVYPGMYHEVQNDWGCEQVLTDIAQWLEEKIVRESIH